MEEWGLGGAMKITLNYSLACFITHDENNKKRKKEKKNVLQPAELMKHLD